MVEAIKEHTQGGKIENKGTVVATGSIREGLFFFFFFFKTESHSIAQAGVSGMSL